MADPSFTILEWCQLRRISRSMFYELDAEDKAPRTHNAGVKRLISPEADRDWIAAREAEAEAKAKAGAKAKAKAAGATDAPSWAEPLTDDAERTTVPP